MIIEHKESKFKTLYMELKITIFCIKPRLKQNIKTKVISTLILF